jgi:opacity protein-like surface antigen
MRTVIAVALATAMSASAMAAEAPVKHLAYARRAAPPPYNWSGLYLGANVGGAWSNRTLTIADTVWDYPFSSAFIGGLQLGYNLQAGYFLVGVEGDFDWGTLAARALPWPHRWGRFSFSTGRNGSAPPLRVLALPSTAG